MFSKLSVRVVAFLVFLIGNATLAQTPAQLSGSSSSNVGVSSATGPSASPLSLDSPQSKTSKLTVKYEGGKLTVVAHGTTLQSVLTVIAQRTGTVIEPASGLDVAPVFVELGPATVHDVLADLLNGSSADYVLIGSRSNPGFVDRLIILARRNSPSGAAESAVVAAVQPEPQPKLYGNQFTTNVDGDSNSSAAVPDEQQAQTTALPPIQHSIDSSMVQFQEAAAAAAASGKSRAEIMTDLQKQLIQQLDAQASQSTPH